MDKGLGERARVEGKGLGEGAKRDEVQGQWFSSTASRVGVGGWMRPPSGI